MNMNFNNLGNINKNLNLVGTGYGSGHSNIQPGTTSDSPDSLKIHGVQPVAKNAPAKSDSIQISKQASFRAELDKAAKVASEGIRESIKADVTENKVEALKQGINGGTYDVASVNVAGAIISRLV